ncbi:hypothetical protein D3C76_1475680 [compost metagenome]
MSGQNIVIHYAIVIPLLRFYYCFFVFRSIINAHYLIRIIIRSYRIIRSYGVILAGNQLCINVSAEALVIKH